MSLTCKTAPTALKKLIEYDREIAAILKDNNAIIPCNLSDDRQAIYRELRNYLIDTMAAAMTLPPYGRIFWANKFQSIMGYDAQTVAPVPAEVPMKHNHIYTDVRADAIDAEKFARFCDWVWRMP